jgi:hypothetical protein
VHRRELVQGHQRLQDRQLGLQGPERLHANSACKGQNACKGQGWTQTTDVVSCTTRGGKVVQ